MKTLSQLIDLYLQGDPATAWLGKYAEHPVNEAGHSEAANYEYALKHLRETEIDLPPGIAGEGLATTVGLLGAKRRLADVTPDKFRPSDLRAIQNRMVQMGRCRNYVNRTVTRIIDLFEWLVEFEYLEPTSPVLKALECVRPIRRGAPGVRETEKTRSVPQAQLDATATCARWIVRQAMRIQELGDMRPGELVRMRICDIRAERNAAGDVAWRYMPGVHEVVRGERQWKPKHKTAHLGQERVIWFGAEGQQILREVVSAVFDQGKLVDGETELPRLGDTADERRIWPWGTTQAYGQAVARARRAAGVQRWTPKQLRNKRTTFIAQEADVTTAAQAAGHGDERTTTKHYIDPSTEKAKQFAIDFG